MNHNWRVRIYRGDELKITWLIKDRTEQQAVKEAMDDPRMRTHEHYTDFDWTLRKVKLPKETL